MRVFIAAAVLLALAGADQQPPPQQIFRTGIDIVTVEASVMDGNGKPVADLKPSDFTVTVGGKPRQVRDLRYYDNGGFDSIIQAGDPLPSAPARNTSDGGRIVVFVVDRDSIAPGGERVFLESASTLLDGLGPADAAGVLALPGQSTELTRDYARVKAALMRLTGSRPTTMMSRDYNLTWDEALAYERRDSLTIARVVERECQTLNRPEGMRNPCPPELETHAFEMLQMGRARTQTVLSNLTTLAAQLEPLRGPKQIVMLSSGFPFGQDLLPLYNDFAKKAAQAQIVFYAVHLDSPGTDVAARKNTTSVFGGADFASGLGNVAAQTGGAFFMASGSGAGIFQRVSNEIHSFYELAVETEPGDRTSGSLEIDVKVARSGVSVRNRRRVLAAPPVPADGDRLSAMLRQPIDVAEVPVALSAYTMRGDDASTLRTIVGLEGGSAASTGPAEWGFAVFNAANVVATGRQKLDANPGPWIAALSAKLLPGKYRLRAALLDGTGHAGVVERPLEVGLSGNAQLQFSDLLIGVADADARLQPSSRIPSGGVLSALVESISADATTLEQVKTMIEIVPGGTATPVNRFLMGARSGALAAIVTNQAEINTAGLPPGHYTAIATPMIGDAPQAKISRIFEIVEK